MRNCVFLGNAFPFAVHSAINLYVLHSLTFASRGHPPTPREADKLCFENLLPLVPGFFNQQYSHRTPSSWEQEPSPGCEMVFMGWGQKWGCAREP